MKQILKFLLVACAAMFAVSCNNASETEKEKPVEAAAAAIKEESITYNADTTVMNGFVAWDSSSTKRRPVVIIIHEWWGLNDYARKRAKQLAELGYLAMAMDMYGNGATADNPDLAGKLAMPFYTNPALAKLHFDAAMAKIRTYAVADTTQIAAIGYCFGGGMVLNLARLGEPLAGVVSFHGSLAGVPTDKNLLKAPILVCHGDSDQFVKQPEVDQFKKQMDSIQANYTFKTYPGAMHAFSNPDATAMGKKFSLPIAYNAAADTASWNEMKAFFGKIFH